MAKIQSFTDLKAWQEGHTLVLSWYQKTKDFTDDEKFGLVNQLRRAGVSITSNIAEGFSRPKKNDKCHFYYISLGSLTEVQNQLLVARDLGYISQTEFKELADQSVDVSKLINGLVKGVQEKPPAHS